MNAPNGTAITLIRGQANAPPVASCVESVNPSGKNIPRAGSKTKPGKKGPGQNEDGFYALFGQDKLGLAAPVSVRNASGSATFGPFPSGSVVKLTEARGARPTTASRWAGRIAPWRRTSGWTATPSCTPWTARAPSRRW